MPRSPLFAAVLTLALASAAHAGFQAQFIEGAPKDRFLVTYSGDCASQPMALTIDLGPSAGALIFDTQQAGAGVEVFQPLDIVAGSEFLTTLPLVADGANKVQLDLSALKGGDAIAFTIDVDDTVSSRQITVDGSEITGARLIASGQSASFDERGTADLALASCSS